MNNFKKALSVFCVLSVGFWFSILIADFIHPRIDCLSFEKNYLNNKQGPFQFERVSSFFWSSLCADDPGIFIISASEGTGSPSFSEVLGLDANEFTGAHRGLKTIAYILSSSMHQSRLDRFRAFALINPVYFSFAASTDSSSIRLTSISALSYFLRISSLHWKWDEFFLASLFIGAKNYFEDLYLYNSPKQLIRQKFVIEAPIADEYDFNRNMLKKKTKDYATFRSKFSSDVEPGRFLFNRVSDFAYQNPDAKICYIMLPVNAKNLDFFGRDSKKIVSQMRALIENIPENSRVDLTHLSYEPYIFLDPMHLTSYGKKRVIEEVLKSSCSKRVMIK